jgi:hypothetical protein
VLLLALDRTEEAEKVIEEAEKLGFAGNEYIIELRQRLPSKGDPS